MADTIRDTALGSIIRYVSGKKLLRYPEEEPGFELPWEAAALAQATSPVSADGQTTNGIVGDKQIESGSSSDEPIKEKHIEKPSALDKIPSTPKSLRRQPTDPEKAETFSRSLTRRTTQGTSGGSIITRRSTREQTSPYTRERHEVEQDEAAQRQESNVIQPQKTSDGVILIDWYTTDDPTNPQNWSSWKKIHVSPS